MSGISFKSFVRSQYTSIPLPNHDFTGQTIIITGASRGLGLEAARHFHRLNASKIILAVRDISKGPECVASITKSNPSSKSIVAFWELDLTNVETIRQFVARAKKLARLDAVILNAGMATLSFQAVDGMEKTLATNVTGTFLLAIGLLPALRLSGLRNNIRPRMVLVSSQGHESAAFAERKADDIFGALNDANKTDIGDRYDTSKLIQLLVFYALKDTVDKSWPGSITFTAVDPGLCDTDLTREMPLLLRIIHRIMKMLLARTAEVGGRCIVFGAVDMNNSHGGYVKDGIIER
ncbi:NAD(P)-binding protein [Fusarium austroafricanum]|uniref:NAD(P)-binding protein n=1 Tax=Fusarium austroafricanum TaxID=2364996 RepID=A0A8H4NYI8_9HYPO|nr:NAD(P)-binding protein [Fusarium austroafricanum]